VSRTRISPYLLTLLGLVVAAVFLVPYAEMLLTSMESTAEINRTPPALIPSHWDPSSFVTMWHVAPIGAYLTSSAVIAGASTLIVLLVAVPAAYYSARTEFRGRRTYLFLVMIAQLLAPVSLVVGLYREFDALGLLDSYLALIIINAAFNISFAIWLLRSFIASVPVELEEAAWIDGCSRWTALRRIVLPTLRPGLVTVAVYAFIAAWNEFVVALTLITTESKKPIQVGITEFIGQNQVDWQHLFASSLVAIVPVVVLFTLIERHLVGGLTAGSVK
jgi:multiple sugar transport system permease protein